MAAKDGTLKIAVEIEDGKLSVHVSSEKVEVEVFDRDKGNTRTVPMSRYPFCVVKNGRKRQP
jgi:hypothetical protein